MIHIEFCMYYKIQGYKSVVSNGGGLGSVEQNNVLYCYLQLQKLFVAMKEKLPSRKLINNKGPRNDHCGTPCYIYFYLLVLRCLFHCSLAFSVF